MNEEEDYINNFIAKVPEFYYLEKLNQLNFINGKVLDFGCGPGQWSIELSKNNRYVVSIDGNSKFINYLENRIKNENINNIVTNLGNVLDFKSEQRFNFILCSNIIQYLPKKTTIILLSALLDKNGKIYISTHDLGYYLLKIYLNFKKLSFIKVLQYINLIIRSLVINTFNLEKFNIKKETYISKNRLIKLLKNNGFEIEFVKIGGHPVLQEKYYLRSPCFYEIVAKKL